MPVTWNDDVDDVLGGDLTAALAYVTQAGGAVVTPVAPIGLRDREAGTVTFTTSLGFGRKLDRIRAEPRVALAYHAREHGFSTRRLFVLVQGTATITEEPSQAYLEDVIGPQATRFMGAPKRGFGWDWLLREYYADRVPVTVTVDRIVAWPDLACAGAPEVTGAPRPAQPPPPQAEPKKGAGPRMDSARAARALRALPHQLVAFREADGYPAAVPVTVGAGDRRGIVLGAAAPGLLPPGGRRAGLLGHDYNAQLIGLAARQHTGWLDVGGDGIARYAAHTKSGFRAPPNKTLLLIGNGLLAKQGLRTARKAAAQ